MKHILIPFFLILGLFLTNVRLDGQSFVRLDDITGLTMSNAAIDSITLKCDTLISALPDTFQNDFKVFDCGFYLMQQYYQGGYPPIFEAMIQKAQYQSDYYLLIGKGLGVDGKTYFFIDIKFPSWSCLSQEEIDGLKANVAILLSNVDNKDIIKNEIISIQMITDFLIKLKNCCAEANRDDCALDNPDLVEFEICYNGFPITVNNPDLTLLISTEPKMPVFTYTIKYNDPACTAETCYPPLNVKIKIKFIRGCPSGVDPDVFPLEKSIKANTSYDFNKYFTTESMNGKVFEQIRGGDVEFKIYNSANFLLKTVNFKIKGQNPTLSAGLKYIDGKVEYSDAWFFKQIIKHESSGDDVDGINSELSQFKTTTAYGENPKFGAPCGWGVCQIDPDPPSLALWNWQANIHKGYIKCGEKAQIVRQSLNTMDDEIMDDWLILIKSKSKKRKIVPGADIKINGKTYSHVMSNFLTSHTSSLHQNMIDHFPVSETKNSIIDLMIIKRYNGIGDYQTTTPCQQNEYYVLMPSPGGDNPPYWKVYNEADIDLTSGIKCHNYVSKVLNK